MTCEQEWACEQEKAAAPPLPSHGLAGLAGSVVRIFDSSNAVLVSPPPFPGELADWIATNIQGRPVWERKP